MNIYALQWDSDFFGLRIGRVDVLTKADVADLQLMHKELIQIYDLLYVFDTNAVGFAVEGAKLVDEKILYSKSCEPRKQFSEISFYQDKIPSNDMYRLSLISGGFSRFKLDRRMPKGSFERLYNSWVENSCPQEGSNKQILLFKDELCAAHGMITVDYNDIMGHIGLLAVDKDYQHKGIASKIMSTLDGYLYEQGVKIIEVPTQKANKNACRWYENNGFEIKSITPIYHWWL